MNTFEVEQNKKNQSKVMFFAGIAVAVVLMILSLYTAFIDLLFILTNDTVFAASLDLLRVAVFIVATVIVVMKNDHQLTLRRLGTLLVLAIIGHYYFSVFVIAAGTVIASAFIIDFFKEKPELKNQD